MASSREFGPNPLAIIGMGCLFPKADGLGQLWWNIQNGVDAITEIPSTHWRPEDYFNSDPKTPDKTYALRGGFLGPINFDPLAFGISPNNLEATDTAQILGLVVADAALRDAGYGPDRDFDRSRVSVVLGVTGTLELVIPLGARLGHPLWQKALKEAGVPKEVADDVVARIADGYVPWQENSFPGLLGNVVAGRIANRLNLGGTNCVVDAACASSISAMHLASLELQSGRSDMVLTGGVDTFNDIFMYMCFSKTPALSPTGNSRPFSNDGDGTILGEGLGIVALKRLADAEKAGDKIYAVIRGIGSSSDGRGNAIYAPSAEGQQRALREAYRVSEVTPESIELIEAHGTGTKVGDATEAAALAEVYGQADRPRPWCAIGSIKSQIGHTKAAAGVAGIIKAALALEKKVLPPTIKVSEPLPAFNDEESPLYVNTQKRPWIANPTHPRRAAVSAFGFGGSNFHSVLEEYDAEPKQAEWNNDAHLLAFSAPTAAALEQKVHDAEKRLSQLGPFELRQTCGELRNEFKGSDAYRLVAVHEPSKGEVGKVLASAVGLVRSSKEQRFASTPDGIYFGKGAPAGHLAMLFPGQGSQYVGMFRDLACQFPQMRTVLAAADVAFVAGEKEEALRCLTDYLYPKATYTERTRKQAEDLLRATDVAQPAIGAVSLGALMILRDLGVRAEAVAGHSYGELTALCAAGRFGLDSLLSLSKLRGRLMAEGTGDRGGMLAVQAPLETIAEVTADEGIDLVLANKNAPNQAVLSGRSAEVNRAAEIFQRRQIRSVRLPVAAAFHSLLVAEASKPFRAALDRIDLSPATMPVFANSTAEVYPDNPNKARELLAGQLAKPVEFIDQIRNLYRDGARTFLEVGPGSKLTGLVRAILSDQEHAAVAIDSSEGKRLGVVDLARSIAQIAVLGHAVDLTKWDPNPLPVTPTVVVRPNAHTVPICGANYVKPKANRPPRPPMVTTKVEVSTKDSTSPGATSSAARTSHSETKAQVAKTSMQQRGDASSNPAPYAQHVSGGDSSSRTASQLAQIPSGVSEAFRVAQENMLAIQRLQEQTADVHRRFLEGQEAAQRNLLSLIDMQRQLVGTAIGHASAPTGIRLAATPSGIPSAPVPQKPMAPGIPAAPVQPVTAPSVARSVVAAPKPADSGFASSVLAVIAEKTGYPAEMLTPEMELDGDLGIDSIKRVEIFAAFQEKFPNAPAVQSDQLGSLRRLSDVLDFLGAAGSVRAAPPQTSVTSAGPAIGADQIFSVIAEKTGYPAEMLSLDMELDGDLGIDSIKRVEIFAAFQEKFPDAPAVQSDQLGSLRTLRSVVEFLGAAAATGVQVPFANSIGVGAAEILAVIAEKTGYPAEMLNLDMELDSDLGIDSIKRVEIFAAFQEKFPNAPAVQSDQLGSLRKLSDVVGFFDAARAGGIEPSEVSISVPAVKAVPCESKSATESTKPSISDDAIERYLLQVVPTPADANRTPFLIPEGSEVWITADGTELTDAIASRLEALAYVPRVIKVNEAETMKVSKTLRGVIVLAPADGTDAEFLRSAFQLARRASPRLKGSDSGVFVTVARCNGSFGFGESTIADPLSGGLAGLAKTVGQEWPNVLAKAIDVASDFEDLGEIAVRIVQEMFLRDTRSAGALEIAAGASEIGLTPGHSWSLQLVATEVPANAQAKPLLQPGDVVVISGGARGVTAEVAEALAHSYQPTIVLLGRSPTPAAEPAWLSGLTSEADIKRAILANSQKKLAPKDVGAECARVSANREIVQNMERIQSAGGAVHYRSVDVRDKDAVAGALASVAKDLGPIRGIVHGAGVLADKRIEDKTNEQFDLVFGTKVTGLQNLLTGIDNAKLTFLVLFSSSTGRFGRAGQVDYAIANECLNKLAQAQAQRYPECRVVSVNWGPWAGGMVNDGLAKLFREEGLGLIGLRSGAEYLVRELSQDVQRPVEVVILGKSPRAALSRASTNGNGKRAVSEAPAATLPVAFERHLDLEGHSFLGSHRLSGHPVLPMAIMVEWLAHGALHGNPGMAFHGIDDLRLIKGVVLRDDQPVSIRVHAGKAVKERDTFIVPVELRGKTTEGKEVLHATAKIVLAFRLAKGKSELKATGVNSVSITPDAIYDEILFHGPHFQGIETCEVWDKGIFVQTSAAPLPADWIQKPLRTSWLADPLALDVSFQAMIVWSLQQRGGRSLPSFVGKYRQFQRSFPRDGVRVVAEVTKSTANHATASIEFVDAKGELVARIDQYECVIDPALEKAFQNPRPV